MSEPQIQMSERREKIKRLVRTLSVFKPSTATEIQYYNFLRELCIINNCSVEEGIERAGIAWKKLSPEQRRFYSSELHAVLPIPVPLNLIYNALRDERCGRLSLAKTCIDGRPPKYVVESYNTELHMRHGTRKEAERRYLDFFGNNSKSNKYNGTGIVRRPLSAVVQNYGKKIGSSLDKRHGRRHQLSIRSNKYKNKKKKKSTTTTRNGKVRKKQHATQTFISSISTARDGMPNDFLLNGTLMRTAVFPNALRMRSANATVKCEQEQTLSRSYSKSSSKSNKSKKSKKSCNSSKQKQFNSKKLLTLNNNHVVSLGAGGTGRFRNIQRKYGSGDGVSRSSRSSKYDKYRQLTSASVNSGNETIYSSVNGVVKSANINRSNASGEQKLKKRKRSKRKAKPHCTF